MEYSKSVNRVFLLLLPFLFTGCYTQFQTYDEYSLENDRYADYYAWDGFEEAKDSEQDNDAAYYNKGDEEALDEELALEQQNIYYKDYETEQWYKDHHATGVNYSNPEKMYWIGYDDGYEDAVDDIRPYYWDNVWFYNNWYSQDIFHRNQFRAWYRFNFGTYSYFNTWLAYNDYQNTFHGFGTHRYNRFGYSSHSYVAFGFGYFNYPWYHGFGPDYYGYGFGYWGHPYYTNIYVYNNYHKTKKYRRSADIYRTGPRNSGSYNAGTIRSRSGSGIDSRTRGSGLTRSRGVNTDVRLRGTGNSTSRGASVGRSTDSRTRGSSSVGKGRTNSGSEGRSRGNVSSVSRDRSDNNSTGRTRSGSNSRSRDNKSSDFTGSSVRTIDISDAGGRTYSIPGRKVNTQNTGSSVKTSRFERFIERNFLNRTTSSYSPGIDWNRSSSVNSTYRSNTSSRSSGVIRSQSSTNRSSGTKVTRSSSNNRSSGTKSRGSSSSSSKKRDRGGN